MTLIKGKENVLIVGRGNSPASEACQLFNGDEIDCCKAILEAGNYPVLMTSISTDRVVNALINVPIYPVPFFRTYLNIILDKEKIDAVFAPFVDSRGWKLVQELEQQGYWDKHRIRVIKDNIPRGFEYDRFRKLGEAVSKAGLKQLYNNEVASEEEARQVLQKMGGLPVLIRTENGVTANVTNIQDFNERLSGHFEKKHSGKVYLLKYPTDSKEVTIGVLKDCTGASALAFTSEGVKNNGIFSADSIKVSPIQTLWKNNREALYKAALSVVEEFEGFVGYCSVTFALDREKENLLVSDVCFSTDHFAAISLGIEASLANVLVKLAMGYSLDDLRLVSEYDREEKSRVLLCVPESKDSSINSAKVPAPPKEEAIYVGHNFCEVLVKLWHGEENKFTVRNMDQTDVGPYLAAPYWDRLYNIYLALKAGITIKEIRNVTNIDPWFLAHIKLIADLEQQLHQLSLASIPKLQWKNLKNCGFSDTSIAGILSLRSPGLSENDVLKRREEFGIKPPITTLSASSTKAVKPKKTIMIVTSADSGPGNFSRKVSSLLLANEARHLGCKVVLVTSDTSALSFWMSNADHMYIEPLNWDAIYEVYLREEPVGIFIEGDYSGHVNLKDRFKNLNVPVANVPVTLSYPGNNHDNKDT